MSLWSKLFGKAAMPAPAPAPAPAPPSAPAPAPVTELDRLLSVGLPGGVSPEDAVEILARLRSSPEEGHALEELVRATAGRALPEPLLFATASALVDRGEIKAAGSILAGCNSAGALLLRADLATDAGDLTAALALVERILLRDLDHPGARERRKRLREGLGLALERKPDASTTTVVAAEPDTPYRLLREAARGGAGAVYEAEDRELGRRVALKVYHEPTRDRVQLLHEAATAVELGGPGVVRIFDVDPEHGWLALEWVSLGAIRERLRANDEGSLRPIERWARSLAVALARVHRAGWVHLDVKPANVLLRAPDDLLLTDFGIARRAGEASPAGSMGYVSPERMAGRLACPRDDVFGFGRILEDVIDRFERAEDAPWRAFAAACTGPDSGRPADADALLARLEAVGV